MPVPSPRPPPSDLNRTPPAGPIWGSAMLHLSSRVGCKGAGWAPSASGVRSGPESGRGRTLPTLTFHSPHVTPTSAISTPTPPPVPIHVPKAARLWNPSEARSAGRGAEPTPCLDACVPGLGHSSSSPARSLSAGSLLFLPKGEVIIAQAATDWPRRRTGSRARPRVGVGVGVAAARAGPGPHQHTLTGDNTEPGFTAPGEPGEIPAQEDE